jgi:hypothetical protein
LITLEYMARRTSLGFPPLGFAQPRFLVLHETAGGGCRATSALLSACAQLSQAVAAGRAHHMLCSDPRTSRLDASCVAQHLRILRTACLRVVRVRWHIPLSATVPQFPQCSAHACYEYHCTRTVLRTSSRCRFLSSRSRFFASRCSSCSRYTARTRSYRVYHSVPGACADRSA